MGTKTPVSPSLDEFIGKHALCKPVIEHGLGKFSSNQKIAFVKVYLVPDGPFIDFVFDRTLVFIIIVQ